MSFSPLSIFFAISTSPSLVRSGTEPIVSMYILRGSFLPRSCVVEDDFFIIVATASADGTSVSSGTLGVPIFLSRLKSSGRTLKSISISSTLKSSGTILLKSCGSVKLSAFSRTSFATCSSDSFGFLPSCWSCLTLSEICSSFFLRVKASESLVITFLFFMKGGILIFSS